MDAKTAGHLGGARDVQLWRYRNPGENSVLKLRIHAPGCRRGRRQLHAGARALPESCRWVCPGL